MSLRYYYRDNDGDLQEILTADDGVPGQFVRRMTISASASAEEGSVGTFELTVDDDDATFNVRGHRRVHIVEDAAAGDAYGGVVWAGYTGDRDVFRGPKQIGAERQWTLHLHDANTILDQRINVGNDHDRPAETDIERIRWILNTNEMLRVENDETYIDDSDPVDMDAVDYVGQKVIDVIDDCAQQSGANYFLFWLDSGEADPVDFYLWYAQSGSEMYTSALRISNDLDDVDQEITYAPDHEMKLNRAAHRVYSGVYQQYDGGAVYVQKASTAERFITRDTIGRAENVKTSGTATRRANRYLDEIDTELDTIACSVIVDGARVNGFMQGMRTFIKATHLPGYADDFQPMRIRDRTVHEIAPDVYEIAMNLVGPSLEEFPTSEGGGDVDGTLRAYLLNVSGPYPLPAGPLLWGKNGDETAPWTSTIGPFDFVPTTAPDPPGWSGIEVTASGVISSIQFSATAIGVGLGVNEPYTILFELTQNDVAIAEREYVVAVGGASNLWTGWATLSATNVSVSSGDIIAARLSCHGADGNAMEGFRSPHGIEPGYIVIQGGAF
jgi:hypothetical protein